MNQDETPYPKRRQGFKIFLGLVFIAFLGSMFVISEFNTVPANSPSGANSTALPTRTQRPDELADFGATLIHVTQQAATAGARETERVGIITQSYVEKNQALQDTLDAYAIEKAALEVTRVASDIKTTQDTIPTAAKMTADFHEIQKTQAAEAWQIERKAKAIRVNATTAGILAASLAVVCAALYFGIWKVSHKKKAEKEYRRAELEAMLNEHDTKAAAAEVAAEVEMISRFINDAIAIVGERSLKIPTNTAMKHWSAERWTIAVDKLKRRGVVHTKTGGRPEEQGTIFTRGDIGEFRDDIEEGRYPGDYPFPSSRAERAQLEHTARKRFSENAKE